MQQIFFKIHMNVALDGGKIVKQKYAKSPGYILNRAMNKIKKRD